MSGGYSESYLLHIIHADLSSLANQQILTQWSTLCKSKSLKYQSLFIVRPWNILIDSWFSCTIVMLFHGYHVHLTQPSCYKYFSTGVVIMLWLFSVNLSINRTCIILTKKYHFRRTAFKPHNYTKRIRRIKYFNGYIRFTFYL